MRGLGRHFDAIYNLPPLFHKMAVFWETCFHMDVRTIRSPQSFEEVVQKYSKSISSKYVFPFIVLADGKPVGFIQSYRADLVGGGWWVNEEPGTWGVDQFIGEDQLIGQGYGSMFLREFTDQLLIRSDVKRVISDPDPKNLRAIRCYEKAGFKMLGEVQTPDGPALLMERSKW